MTQWGGGDGGYGGGLVELDYIIDIDIYSQIAFKGATVCNLIL